MKHRKMVIFTLSIEPFTFHENTAAPEYELEGEPAFQFFSSLCDRLE